jgi:hypothetical protein
MNFMRHVMLTASLTRSVDMHVRGGQATLLRHYKLFPYAHILVSLAVHGRISTSLAHNLDSGFRRQFVNGMPIPYVMTIEVSKPADRSYDERERVLVLCCIESMC